MTPKPESERKQSDVVHERGATQNKAPKPDSKQSSNDKDIDINTYLGENEDEVWVSLGVTLELEDGELDEIKNDNLKDVVLRALKEGRAVANGDSYVIQTTYDDIPPTRITMAEGGKR